MAKAEISSRMKKMLNKGRAEARRHVIERGLVQLWADVSMMRRLLEISEYRGMPLGTVLREWVKDRLRNEGAARPETTNDRKLRN